MSLWTGQPGSSRHKSPELCPTPRWRFKLCPASSAIIQMRTSHWDSLKTEFGQFSSFIPNLLACHLSTINLFLCNSIQTFNQIQNFSPLSFLWKLFNLLGTEVFISQCNSPNLILYWCREMIISEIYYFILPLCHPTIPLHDKIKVAMSLKRWYRPFLQRWSVSHARTFLRLLS